MIVYDCKCLSMIRNVYKYLSMIRNTERMHEASFPQIYSNNKKGRESDFSDSKNYEKTKQTKKVCLWYYSNLKM